MSNSTVPHSIGTSSIVVTALYHFVRLENFKALRQPLLDCLIKNQVKGTLLLANEGINGTIAGSRSGIDAVLDSSGSTLSWGRQQRILRR